MKTAFILMMVFYSGLAKAEDRKDCFDVIPPAANSPLPSAIKIDRCTGTTWVLIRVYPPKGKDAAPGPFRWRWFPILEDVGEATIGLQ